MSIDVREALKKQFSNIYKHIQHPILECLNQQISTKQILLPELNNILIYGQDSVLCILHYYHIIATLFDTDVSTLKTNEVVCNDFQIEFIYNTNKYFIEIDMDTCLNKEKTSIIEFIKYVSITPHMFSKHIIVLLNFDKVNKQQQNKMRCIIEKCHKNTLFITQCCNVSKMDKSIISRFICIRVPTLSEKQSQNLVTYFVQEHHTDTKYVNKLTNNIINSTNNHISNIYLKCQSNILMINKKNSANFIQTELQKLFDYLHKSIIHINVINKIRTTLYLILHYNVSPPYIIMKIIEILTKNTTKYFASNPQILHHIIHIMANLDHDIAVASKPAIHFEKAIVEIYMLMKESS